MQLTIIYLVLNSFKSRLFPIKYLDKTPTCEPTPEPATEPEVATKATKAKTKRKISSLKLCEKPLNEIKSEEKTINEQIFNKFLNYNYPSFLVKYLYEDNQNKNEKIVKNFNESLINLRNFINSIEIPENENPKKILEKNILQKVLDFNKQQKGKGIKTLTPKQMLQRLLLALPQVKAGNTFGNLLNEIRQIMYSLYQEKEVTKKVYNNIMNSIKL